MQNTLSLHANTDYASGLPTGTAGTVEVAGRRYRAVRQGWTPGRNVWVLISNTTDEWFRCSPLTVATFQPA